LLSPSELDSKGLIEFTEIGLAVEALVQQRDKDGVGAIAGNIIRVCDARNSGELEYLQTHEACLSPAEGQAGFSLLARAQARARIHARALSLGEFAGRLPPQRSLMVRWLLRSCVGARSSSVEMNLGEAKVSRLLSGTDRGSSRCRYPPMALCVAASFQRLKRWVSL
jgi:hypothetical protein